MRSLFFSVILFLSIQLSAQTNTVATVTLSVKGNCEQCKERIENAADIKGVKLCVWNVDTKVATITYKTDKVTIEKIREAIVKAGHDVAEEKATEVSYKKLPGCCRYRDRNCEEKK